MRHAQLTLLALFLFLTSCGPKVTQCVINIPKGVANCRDLDNDKKFDKPFGEMDKWSCLSPDDMAELMRGNGKNSVVCAIVSAHDDHVYCTRGANGIHTTLAAINKYTCFTADDLAYLIRYIGKKNGK